MLIDKRKHLLLTHNFLDCLKKIDISFFFRLGIYIYVVLKDGVVKSEDNLRAEFNDLVKKRIAAYAMADMIQVCLEF